LARHLHLSGRRRVVRGSGWVATPNVVRAATAPVIKPWEDETMKWTKPEAEIVAVTMEVTAYVATL
jgi:coenzyme PQQ precursor peptide PqqA